MLRKYQNVNDKNHKPSYDPMLEEKEIELNIPSKIPQFGTSGTTGNLVQPPI
jgi:hypothetical protein